MITNNNSYLNDSIANTGTGTTISDILDTVVAVSNINGKSTKTSKQKQYKFPGAVVDSKGNTVYIKEVIYSNPATIVLWSDKTKTICKAVENDTYNPDGLKDGRIYVPDNKVEELKTATNWSVFADIIVPLSTLVEE